MPTPNLAGAAVPNLAGAPNPGRCKGAGAPTLT